MTSERKLPISSLEHNSGEHELTLPNGARRHIRRLKEEGNLREATLVRNAAMELKNSVHQRLEVQREGDCGDQS